MERETGLEPATACLEDMLSPVGLFPPFTRKLLLGRLSLVLSGSQCPISLSWAPSADLSFACVLENLTGLQNHSIPPIDSGVIVPGAKGECRHYAHLNGVQVVTHSNLPSRALLVNIVVHS